MAVLTNCGSSSDSLLDSDSSDELLTGGGEAIKGFASKSLRG